MDICERGSDFFLRREIGRPACRSLERGGNVRKVGGEICGSKTRNREESSEIHDEWLEGERSNR